MDAQLLLKELKRKFELSTDRELAEQTGIGLSTINSWKNNGTLTEKQVANLLHKAVEKGGEIALQNGIQPIVEFYPITHTESKQGARWEMLSNDDEENSYEIEMKEVLQDNNGIYLFYSSTGHVIYAGKAQRMTLWDEMNSAFNRKRFPQKAFLVDHPTNSQFKPAYEKLRDIKVRNVYLFEIAHYFSAYYTHDALIINLEAFLIRALANDLTNSRMEKIKSWGG
ncbi:hypothetical protein BCS42_08835 [Crenothrix sp. D3]|nr:hypothetical protein BCS42_08835 [Crenothrix sp. D3]